MIGGTHRGGVGNPAEFARRFILGRLAGFEKDISICLTPARAKGRPSATTHAYFPALAACCGTLEYLTALYRGRIDGIGWQQIAQWATAYLPQPEYDQQTIRILFEAFRHPVAHRGIASGVWIDRQQGPGRGRRLTWSLHADAKRPPCEVVQENGVLKRDSPWPSPYTHRVHIHLKGLASDIRKAAARHAEALAGDAPRLANFMTCMRQLYPQ